MFAKLALKSLLDRKGSVALSIMAMTVSIFVLLGVEQIRQQAKDSFANTVSGVDLIVGARTGSLNLLLYSVFKIGAPTNNIRWSTYQDIASNSKVKWAIPIALGDSHKGFRVMGTTDDYFKYFHYGKRRPLSFAQGRQFEGVFDVVLGAQVARKLGYSLGNKIVLAHGIASTSFSMHDDMPFTVVGILDPTGTPVDQSLYVSLQSIEAIHKGWNQGVKMPSRSTAQDSIAHADLEPKSITAFMLGLESRMTTFGLQRAINNYPKEPLLAILPGVALSELWQMMGILENTLLVISSLVFVAACLGVSAMLLSSIRERGKEIQLLRVVGAPPYFLFLLIELETLFITVCSIFLAAVLLATTLLLSQDYLMGNYGLYISGNIDAEHSAKLLIAVVIAAFIAALIPSIYAFKKGIHASN